MINYISDGSTVKKYYVNAEGNIRLKGQDF